MYLEACVGTTPNLKLPFPELTDVLDGPDAISDLASATEDYFYNRNLPTGVVRMPSYYWGSGTTFPSTGVAAGDTYRHTDLGLMCWNGSAWRQAAGPLSLSKLARTQLSTSALHQGFEVIETEDGQRLFWTGSGWKKMPGGPPVMVASNINLLANGNMPPGTVGGIITGTQNVPVHTPGTLHLSGHVILTGVNVCAGFVQIGIGPSTSTLTMLGVQSRYHNNGNVQTWTIPVNGYYDSDGTTKVMCMVGWADSGSGGNVTVQAASLAAALL